MKKKGFTLIELMGVIIILGILAIVIIPNIITQIKNRIKDVDETTRNMVYKAASLYMDQIDTSNIGNGSTFCIPLRDLVNNGFLSEPIINLGTNKEISLDEVVKVIYNYESGEFMNYELTNSDSCVRTSNPVYVTVDKLKNEANQVCNALTKESCVKNTLNKIDSFNNPSSSNYSFALSYAYMGASPNNLVVFGGEEVKSCWSIIGISNTNSLKLVYEGSAIKNEGYECNSSGRSTINFYNSPWYNELNSYDFSNSNNLIKNLLNNFVNSDNLDKSSTLNGIKQNILFTSKDKTYLENVRFYTGSLNNKEVSLHDILLLEKNLNYDGYVGIPNLSDYYISSINENCNISNMRENDACSYDNFMYVENSYWTLNNKASTSIANSITEEGYVGENDVTDILGVRPVIYLKGDTKFIGSGTSNNPYIVQ